MSESSGQIWDGMPFHGRTCVGCDSYNVLLEPSRARFRCTDCGRVFEAPSEWSRDFSGPAFRRLGSDLLWHLGASPKSGHRFIIGRFWGFGPSLFRKTWVLEIGLGRTRQWVRWGVFRSMDGAMRAADAFLSAWEFNREKLLERLESHHRVPAAVLAKLILEP